MNKQKQLELNKERFDRLVRSEFLNISLEDVGKYNPLFDRPYKEDIDNPLLHLLKVMRNPDYFYLTCKYIFNMNVPPLQAVFLKELWTHAFPMLIGSRGGAKTSSLALYAMLRAFLQQGSRIAIVGSAFRQSKMVFTYCESIWYNAPVLRNICTSYPGWQGPRHQMDKYEMVIGDSTISAFPLGTGEKIRGQRANVIIADEFAFIPLEIYQTVVHGFGAVSLSPVENMQRRAQIRVLKKLGMWTNEYEHQERKRASANQSIVAGTAYYDFSGFANYWKQYKAIIESKGDPAAMAVIFGGEVPHGISWEDFCIIRIPVEMYPEGFMDEKNIARGKAMIATSIYQMEYSACVSPTTLIITDKTIKPISNIQVGDLVLTHRGRFRPVTKVMQREYKGNVVLWRTDGYNQTQITTPEHPFWQGKDNWVPIGELDSCTLLANKDGGYTKFQIQAKKTVNYDGLVYNLEVDEDNSYSLLNATVHNCFIGDTNGFFPASLLHRCTVKEDEYLYFKATIKGNLSSKYVYGVDPASEASRFSIIVLELHENHRRIVYGWSTNREEHRQKLKSGSVKQKDFYQYCARKIRDLMKVFPCEAIALDVGGGGRTIAETLQDADRLEAGELPILEVMTNSPLNWTGKVRETDDRHGLHIIELVDFGRADWVVEANHGMKKDLLDRILLFPQFDAVELAQSTVEDLKSHRGYDNLEDCVMEIHDLFDELTTIVHTQTPATHRDHWDTPEIRQPGSKKGVLRKDRYSALLMANMAARRLQRFETYIYHGISGGFAGQITSEQSSLKKGIPAYDGPPWFTQHANTYKNCGVVKREGV